MCKVLLVASVFGLSFVSLAKDLPLDVSATETEIRKEYSTLIPNRVRMYVENISAPFLSPKENEDVLVCGWAKIKAEDIVVTYVSGGVTNEYCFPCLIQEDVRCCNVITTRVDTALYSRRDASKDRIGPNTSCNYKRQQDFLAGEFPICTIGTNGTTVIRENYKESGSIELFVRYIHYDKALK